MYQIIWLEEAKEDFSFWMKNDASMAKRINMLIESIILDPKFGIGKHEKLKHKFTGYFSRRINLEHRLIYKVLQDKKQIFIVSCKGHYENKI